MNIPPVQPPVESPVHPPIDPASLVILVAGALAGAGAFAARRRLLPEDRLHARAAQAARIPGARWMLAGIAGWLAWVFVGGFSLAAAGARGDSGPSLSAGAWMMVPAYLAGLGAVVAALWTVRAHTAPLVALRRSHLRDGAVACLLGLPIALAVGTLTFLAAHLLSRLTGAPPPGEVAHGTLEQILAERESAGLSWWLLPVALQVVVLAPLFEEVVYRGCVQSALLSVTGRTWLAAILASMLFSLVHVGATPWHALPTLFMVGLTCALLVERSGRIWPAVAFHAAFNGVNLGLALASAG